MNEKMRFKFKDIQLLSKKLYAPPQKQISGNYNFIVRTNSQVIEKDSLVLKIVDVKIADENLPELLAEFQIICMFYVYDFDTVITKDATGLYKLPEDLETIIDPVSVSTCRGIIYSELKGTYLNAAILPILYPLKEGQDPLLQDKLNLVS